MFLREQRFGLQSRMNGFRHRSIIGGRRCRFHVGDQMGLFLITGFREMHFVAGPQNFALDAETSFSVIG